ncbi:MAG: hypothetical protein H6706_06830 [Myxococcales bacterium]|nr:hypothetical protein [Myxococcales bacterium]
MNERRRERSEVPAEAARLYLQAAARRGGYRALGLADADGLLVVDNDPLVDMEAVAAIAPLANHHDAESGLLRLVTRGEPLRVWPMELDGDAYYLAAVGGTEKAPADAPAALARILMRPSVVALSA